MGKVLNVIRKSLTRDRWREMYETRSFTLRTETRNEL